MKNPKTIQAMIRLAFEPSRMKAAYNDFLKILNKYSGMKKDYTLLTKQTNSKEGYYAMFVKKDYNLPEKDQIQVACWGENISGEELMAAMSETLEQTFKNAETKVVEYNA